MPGTKWGIQRWGDPRGDSRQRITEVRVERSAFEPGMVRLSWTSALDAKGVWYKVFRDRVQVAVTRELSVEVSAHPGMQHVFEVIDVGPLNGDLEYDITAATEIVPGNRIKVTWDRAADFAAYAIYWDSGGGTVDLVTPLVVLDDNPGVTQQSYITDELAAGTYKFVVRARDAAGNESTNVAEQSATIATWPKPPVGLSLSYDSGTQKVTLTWTDPPGTFTNIRVYQGEQAITGEWDQLIGSWPDADYTSIVATVLPAVETWLSGALALGKIHTFALRTWDGTYEEKNVDVRIRLELSAANDNRTLRPAKPEGMEAVAIAAGKIRVSAFVPAKGGHALVDSATIYQNTVEADLLTGTGSTSNAATVTAVAGGWLVEWTSGALADGTKYYFIVRPQAAAGDGGGLSDFAAADVVSATADLTVPAAPASQGAAAVRGGDG